MTASDIVIKGAREHNLRDVQLELPRNQLICFTGVSGSGKSSLAFDTLYAEGQRRYVESLSSFARQFLGQMPKPDVDLIGGLSPTISISQKAGGQNPRSTVGTITEIYDYLRVLYARVGKGFCPKCGKAITAQTRGQIIDRISVLPSGTKCMVLAPIVRQQKGEHRDLLSDMRKEGYSRARIDGEIIRLSDDPHLDRRMRHDIEVVIDRLTLTSQYRTRLAEAVEAALRVGEGHMLIAPDDSEEKPNKAAADGPTLDEDLHLSADYACTDCGISFDPPSPRMFSFNSPQGMCKTCDGLGDIHTFSPELLIPDPSKSFQQGAIEPLGKWSDMGRWRRHIYRGVAETLERTHEVESGSILETSWEDLDPEFQRALLWGTGDLHITFTWRGGASGHKWGGKFEGIIPKMLSQFKTTKSRMQRRAMERYMSVVPCHDCRGARLNEQARHVRLKTLSEQFADKPSLGLPEVSALPISDAREFFGELELDATGEKIAEETLKEIRGRLGFLTNVGLEYLTLHRTAPTLSGGELQRIRLAGQIGCGLVGVLYILDEPSIGLHPRDNDRLLLTLEQLRDQGNTVVVVEHDEDTMRAADHIVDFGPGPGVRGGHVVAQGPMHSVIEAPKSITGDYLSGIRRIAVPEERRPADKGHVVIRGARHNNLKNVDIAIPVGTFVCITGVSGSGKSSMTNDILIEVLRRDLNWGDGYPGDHDTIEGLDLLDKMIAIDQSPIGRTPRSNPATYIKLFDEIRKLYCQLPEAKQRGYKPGRFSFNVKGGRCEACEGNGAKKLEMDFLADVWVTCPVCEGKRFNHETLHVRYRGKSIAEVLEMDVQEALEHFENVPKIKERLQTLHDVGLDYMKLGQPSPTLSGGEAQRVKLARELAKKSTGKTIYLLDEPTTGLHFADIEMLLKVLHDFVNAGNTVVVVEHNLDVIKTADWIVDLGPEGGNAGGEVIAEGTPEQIAEHPTSHTGQALRKFLEHDRQLQAALRGECESPLAADASEKQRRDRPHETREIVVRGAKQHNLQGVDVDIPRDQLTVCCGPSGSGKSSLAMDTIYAEGQRRYVESLSAYARQFVGQMQKPRLDHIEGLSPAIAIEQKSASHSPRSTVGTVTEIYDYLRIILARLGEPYCPNCDIPIGTQTSDEIIAKVMNRPSGTRLILSAPLALKQNETYEDMFDDLRASGYVRVRIDGVTYNLEEVPEIDRRRHHEIEVVVDRIVLRKDNRGRIADSVEDALDIGRGWLHVIEPQGDDVPEPRWPVDVHSQHFACGECGRSFEPLSPHNFSFNSSLGWCPTCEGLGVQTGANPVLLLHDPKLSMAEGAVALWPNVDRALYPILLDAFSRGTGIPTDVPFEELGARHRRLILHGTGEQWFDAHASPEEAKTKGARPMFRFQYKGLFPTLEEAGRLTPSFRGALAELVDEVECYACGGSRLRDDASAVRLDGHTVDEMCRMPLARLAEKFEGWKLNAEQRKVAGEIIREIRDRVRFLVDVGLDYLTLGRPAPTLSGGEAQRIRLAAQVGSGLCGVLYVLDEPTIGLHPRDNRRLLDALKRLRDLGNTLLVVEHDKEVIANADQLLDFGPKAGKHGGRIVARGTPEQAARRKGSVTGPYLNGTKAIPIPTNRRMKHESAPGNRLFETVAKPWRKKNDTEAERPTRVIPDDGLGPSGAGELMVIGARHNNLREISVRIPLGTFTVVTGPSGSGKSSLVEDVLYQSLAKTLHRAKASPGAHDAIHGMQYVNKVIRVDQQPLGQTPTSNAATFTGVFELIRQLFAQLPESKLRGYSARRFSFNVPGGRCEKCEGAGQLRIEMHFLPDVWVPCDACNGTRYERETLNVRYHGRSIADVLEMSCAEALVLFKNIPKIRRILQTLCDVGLDYLTLGQAAPTLSGGEAQRVKLAAELSRPDTGRTLYLLDEPTTGLHFDDLAKLLDVINRLVDLGNTVVVIEHNLDVIKTADWIIDLGPEAGHDGGNVVVEGTPEDVVAYSRRWKRLSKAKKGEAFRSHTGEVLDEVLVAGPYEKREIYDLEAAMKAQEDDVAIDEVGGETRMPWEADGRRWHMVDRVGRNGNPCRWDGKILGDVADRIQEADLFSETDWRNRSVVEIRAAKKSDGWFFHAITGEQWLLKMKFRVPKNTFKGPELVKRLDLRPLNEMPDLPLYGTEMRASVQTVRGPWQEIELRVHSYNEIDRPEFWSFLDEAINGFRRHVEKARENPEDLMPWKVLGRKWHEARKGFNVKKAVAWRPVVLEKVFTLLEKAAPESEATWTNKVIVPFHLDGRSEPWATVGTKFNDSVHVTLLAPKGRFALGRILDIGRDPEFDGSREEYDMMKLYFRTQTDLKRGDFPALLEEVLASLR